MASCLMHRHRKMSMVLCHIVVTVDALKVEKDELDKDWTSKYTDVQAKVTSNTVANAQI